MTNVLFRRLFIVGIVSILFAAPASAHAASLHAVSDLITTSAPSATSSHTFQFTITQSIPASGHIVITPQASFFSIPAGLDYTDVDLAVSSGGPYVDRDLASSVSALDDGVSVVAGASGSITITLNSSTGIGAGALVRITVGTAAIYGDVGDQKITNPDPIGSYKLSVATTDQSGIAIDSGTAMIAVVDQVLARSRADAVAPTISNGLPSGTLAAGNSTIELTFDTNMPASCRYATTTNVLYENMTGIFTSYSTFSFHAVITGHQDNTTYNYYVRCISEALVANDADYVISFTINPTQISNSSIVPTSDFLGNGGQGDFRNGSSLLYLSSVTMTGWALPLSTITTLRDGKIATVVQAKQDGSFSATIGSIERGTYTFQAYFTDSHGRRSASYTQTLALGSGSSNILSSIVIAPTAELSSNSIAIGDPVIVSGESILNGKIELVVQQQGKGGTPASIQSFSASTSPTGTWRIPIAGNKFQKGSYTIKARVILNDQARSEYGKLLFLGVGQNPSADLSLRADINHDGKVNLIDFSILLSNWGSSDADSDINQDDIVNLADFSILLFNWTG